MSAWKRIGRGSNDSPEGQSCAKPQGSAAVIGIKMIIDRFMPSCREVAQKLAEGEFENLPWHKRLLIRMHLSMCAHCSRFARQLGLIAQALRSMWRGKPDPRTLDAVKRRILTRLHGV